MALISSLISQYLAFLLEELRIEQRKARNALASLCFVQKAKHKLNNAFLSFDCSMRSSSSKKARYWVHGKDGNAINQSW